MSSFKSSNQKKWCPACHQVKPAVDFYSCNINKGDGLQGHCKVCHTKYMARWGRENTDRTLRSRRKHVNKRRWHWTCRKYGVTERDYYCLLKKQKGRCAICGTDTPNGRSAPYFNVDHCHITGKVRGLLCFSCNVGIGFFSDRVDVLKRAVEYLEND